MAWAFVAGQGAGAAGTGATTIVLAMPGNVTAGNRIIAGAGGQWSLAVSTVSFTDNRSGNTWQNDVTFSDAGDKIRATIGSVQVGATGACSVTATYAIAPDFGSALSITEYSGLDTSSTPTDVTADGAAVNPVTGTSQSVTYGTATHAANELVVGLMVDPGATSTLTAGAGYTRRAGVNGSGAEDNELEDKDSGSSGSTIVVAATSSVSTQLNLISAIYKLAAGGVVPGPLSSFLKGHPGPKRG